MHTHHKSTMRIQILSTGKYYAYIKDKKWTYKSLNDFLYCAVPLSNYRVSVWLQQKFISCNRPQLHTCIRTQNMLSYLKLWKRTVKRNSLLQQQNIIITRVDILTSCSIGHVRFMASFNVLLVILNQSFVIFCHTLKTFFLLESSLAHCSWAPLRSTLLSGQLFPGFYTHGDRHTQTHTLSIHLNLWWTCMSIIQDVRMVFKCMWAEVFLPSYQNFGIWDLWRT